MRWGFVVRVVALLPDSQSFSRALARTADEGLRWVGRLAVTVGLLVIPAAAAKNSSTLQLITPDVVLADPGETIELPVAVTPAEAIPDNALLRIKGLPPRVTLSAGYLVSPGNWAVPLAAIGTLKVSMPNDLTARAEISFLLADVDGRVHAEKQSRLIVARTGTTAPNLVAQIAAIAIPTLAMPLVPVEQPSGLLKARDAAAKGPQVNPYSLPALASESQLKIPPAVRLELEQILAEGDQALLSGDTEFARRVYRLVTERGLGLAAIKMAETFDPIERGRLRITDAVESEPLAKAWYRRAADLGEFRATERLKRFER